MQLVDWKALMLFSLVGAMSAAIPSMFLLDKYVVHAHTAGVALHGIAG